MSKAARKRLIILSVMLGLCIALLCACTQTQNESQEPVPDAGSMDNVSAPNGADTEDRFVFPREDEEYTETAQAVIAAAKAYYDHRIYVQYDQLNMNRVTRTDPRYEFVTPETASYQRYVYMECGVFARNVYKNVLGYTIPLAGEILTADYPNEKGERVYYWEGKSTQTQEDADRAYKEMLSVIQPGDVIYYNYIKNNHIMLYIGNGEIIHCSYSSGEGDYVYSSKTDKLEKTGALYHTALEPYIAKKKLFEPQNKVCLLRPSLCGLEITDDARIRVQKLTDIVMNKSTSVFLGTSVNPGTEVTVALKLKNKGDKQAQLQVAELLPEGFEYVSGCFDNAGRDLSVSVQIESGKELELSYILKVKEDVQNGTLLDCDGTRVEGMYLSNNPIYVADTLADSARTAFASMSISATNYQELIAACYSGTDMSQGNWQPGDILENMFTTTDRGTKGTTVTPNSQQTSIEGMCLVPGMYGGQNCNSIEGKHNSRIRRVTVNNILAGDIILYSTDGKKENAQMVVYAGNGLGYTVKDGNTITTDVKKLCDSLLGQYCFCILRPSVMF